MKKSFISSFAPHDSERYYETRIYALKCCNTMLQQIITTLGRDAFNVMASWGCVSRENFLFDIVRWREMPTLAIRVSGFQHNGYALVSLNEGTDTYEVELADENMQVDDDSVRETDVYCDELANVIDRLVETGDMSKEQYDAKIVESLMQGD